MEEIRRRQLIEATIAAIHDVGFNDATVSRIAAIAGVSAGIVHHYFEDKADLLEATLRELGNSLRLSVVERLSRARNERDRLIAVIEGNLGPDQFTPTGVSAWLAFWAMVPKSPRLARVQSIIVKRLHSNLVHALRPFVAAKEVERVARSLACLIDGIWLRAAMDPTGPDPQAAMACAQDFLDHRLTAGFEDNDRRWIGAKKYAPLVRR
jgi:transcriptional repressor BetI